MGVRGLEREEPKMVSSGGCEVQVEDVSSPSSSRGHASQECGAEARNPGRPAEGAPGTDLRLQQACWGVGVYSGGDGSWKVRGLES